MRHGGHQTVHVLFVALYSGDSFVDKLEQTAKHLNATPFGESPPIQFHALVNRNVPGMSHWCIQHMVSSMPASAQEQHRNLSHGKPRGASIFLWKPFLYHVVMVDRLIVLDMDVVLTPGAWLHDLWLQFDLFEKREVLGVSREQGPTYAHYGHAAGFNGGVQLHHLARMRARHDGAPLAAARDTAPSYDETLRHCAAGGCTGWDRIEPSLGDQTLYTHLCLRAPHLCRVLPCGWNRQMSTHYYTAPHFVSEWHVCNSRCRLLHFNQPLLMSLVPLLQQTETPLTCSACRAALTGLENHTRKTSGPRTNPKFTWGSSKQYMASKVEACCCEGEAGGAT
jgi:hypothetical protein